MRAAANLNLLFTEHPLEARFAAARAAGFTAVELLFPYEMAAHELATRLADEGLELALINTPAGDWAAGERGFAAVPGARARFRDGFRLALDYAAELAPAHIHVMAGLAEGPEAEACFTENLQWAANAAGAQRLTIEPINPHDMPGYFLKDFTMAQRLLGRVGAPGLALQFDAYHAQRITGCALAAWADHGAAAAHVQVAGVPGRHEPEGGDLDYAAFFAALSASGYAGYVSGEYFPAGRTEDGLGWLDTLRTAAV